MQRPTAILGIVFFLVAAAPAFAGSWDVKPPDFSAWRFIDEEPLTHTHGGVPYQWGVQRKFRLPSDSRNVGFERISSNGETFYKIWGIEGEAAMSFALRREDSAEWFGGFGGGWSLNPTFDAGGKVNGIWFSVFRAREVYGRLFPAFPLRSEPSPPFVPAPLPPSKKEGKI